MSRVLVYIVSRLSPSSGSEAEWTFCFPSVYNMDNLEVCTILDCKIFTGSTSVGKQIVITSPALQTICDVVKRDGTLSESA